MSRDELINYLEDEGRETGDLDWGAIVDFVAEWIGDMGLEDNAAGSMAAKWREEMGS